MTAAMVRGGTGGGKAWALAGAVSLLLYAAAGTLVTGPGDTALWLVLYAAAWLPYLWVIRREGGCPAALVLVWAALARWILAGSALWLSDDLYRYLLDGQLLSQGINPFRFPPAAPEVRALEPLLAALVNHPGVPTIYPPLVQVVGAGAALADLGPTGWRLLMGTVDVGATAAVARLFGSWRAAAVYGLCPLAVWEAGANGHTEALLAWTLVLSLHAWRRGRVVPAGLALGAAALVKLFPLLLAVMGWRSPRGRRIAAVAGAVFLAAWLPFAAGGVDPTAGLRTYLSQWSFNSPVHQALEATVGQLLPVRWVAFAWLVGAGAVAGARRADPVAVAPHLLFGFLLLGPTLHPWYALWLLPLLGPDPHRGLWAFTAAVGFSYQVWWEVGRTGLWRLDPLVQGALWARVVLGWIVEWRRSASTVGRPPSPPLTSRLRPSSRRASRMERP